MKILPEQQKVATLAVRYVVISAALMTCCLQVSAGPYTNAAKLNKFCTTVGTDIGAIAYDYGERTWLDVEKYQAEINELENRIKSASKSAAPPSVEVLTAKTMLPTTKKLLASSMGTQAELKAIYIKRVALDYGETSKKIAQRIWSDVSKADSEDDAKQLAYASCMDYFFEK